MKGALTAVSVMILMSTAALGANDNALKQASQMIFDGNDSGAIKILNTLIKSQPANAIAYAKRGHAYHDLSNNARAIQDLQKAISLDPHCAEAYYELGRCHATAKNLPKAIELYSKAIEQSPKNIDYYSARGMLFQHSSKNKESVADFTKCIELDAKAKWAYVQRAISNQQDKNYDAALIDLNKLVAEGADNFNNYEMRGKCLLDKGDAEAAAKDFSQVIKMEPKYAGGYAYHARAMQKLEGPQSKQAAADFVLAKKYGYEPAKMQNQ